MAYEVHFFGGETVAYLLWLQFMALGGIRVPGLFRLELDICSLNVLIFLGKGMECPHLNLFACFSSK